MDHQDIEVPSFFLCPISLEIMKDPVTVSTGITYDRESIEKWLFSNNNSTCPVTKQELINGYDITPNHTLRRMIQFWCTLHASRGIERIPTPKPPVTKLQVEKLIREAKSDHQRLAYVIKKLRLAASENATNKRCVEDAGVPEFLISVVGRFAEDTSDFAKSTVDEALSLLHNLQISENGFKNLLERNGGVDITASLSKILRRGSYDSRVYAVLLLESLVEMADPSRVPISNMNPELFSELVRILKDQISQTATKAALQTLIAVCPQGRNRQKAVAAGAVPVLIEFLANQETSSERKRMVEMGMGVLDLLCHCAEGRSAFLEHALGIAVVSKRTLRVSKAASERAVGVLLSVGRFCGTAAVAEEMVQVGVAAKMLLVLQSDCGSKTKEKARELLRLHGRVWRASPCVPLQLLASI